MFRYLPLMVKNALRNRRRSILTICSVGASLCLLGLLMAIFYAFYLSEPSAEQARRVVTRNRISLANPLPVSYKDKIATIPGVQDVMVMQWFGGVYKDPQNFFARMGVDSKRLLEIYPEYKISAEERKAFENERTACIIGKDTATKFNLKVGDRMTLQGDIFPIDLELTIRGIYDYLPDNESLYFHVEYLWESLPVGQRDFAGTFAILADKPENVTAISKAVDDMFRNAPQQTRTESERAFQLGFVAFLGDVKTFLAIIAGAVTFTMLLVTANTMAMSVRERIREVGVLKTLGFTNGSILGMILGEATVLSILGGMFGWLLAAGLAYGVRQGPAFFAELKTLTIPTTAGLLLLAVAAVIGLASSFIPAWGASRTNILDALRYNG